MDKKKQTVDEKTYLGSLEPYFELVQNEYQNERNRKQSLETRSGIVLTIIVAMVAIILDKIPFRGILEGMTELLSFIVLLKIVSGLLIYIFLIASVFYSFKTLTTTTYVAFNIANISNKKLGNIKNFELLSIITTYRDIIKKHREINEKKAKAFTLAIEQLIFCALCVVIYINL